MKEIKTVSRRLLMAVGVLGALSVAQNAFSKVHVADINFHNIGSDTTIITEILIESEKIADPNERIISIARRFAGLPYVAGTLESKDGKESLTVNLDELDCTTFVETVLALAKTAGERRTSWRDYVATLEDMRYRNGELNGYPSRLHYNSDWVVDNTHRGNLNDVTSDFPGYRTETKTLDYMSKHANLYPALADSVNLEGVKSFEMGYRKHRFNYIPWNILNSKNVREKLKEGDVIGLLSKIPGLDVGHMGIIFKDDKGVFHLLHASMKGGKVMFDSTPLYEMLRKQGIPGIRVIRLKE